MAENKSMPYNLEAEQCVLGCILIDQIIQSDIISDLKMHDFLVESHKIIFEAMRAVYNNNATPIDLVTLTDFLQKNAVLDKIGGMPYLIELTNVIPSSANYLKYIDIVKRDSVLRRLITGSNDIIKDAYLSNDSRKSLLNAESIIFQISEDNNKRGLELINEYFPPVIEKFEKLEKDKNFQLGLKTGFRMLDFMTNGLHKGNLIILAARPSVGKTTLAMNIVEHFALKQNAVCAVFALEMTKEELAQRMLCSVGKVNMDDALKGNLTKKDSKAYNRLWQAQKLLNEAKIFIDESSQVTPQDILSSCRRLKARNGLDLIVVDHIQLMQSARKNIENRQQEVTEISRGLKMISKELDVPVIALSQLSRGIESRKGGKPVLSDLRESGAIEQDADLVLFIHRPEKDANKDEESVSSKTNITELIIAKNRNGICGDIRLVFKGEFVKFIDYVENIEPHYSSKGKTDYQSPPPTEDDYGAPPDDSDIPSDDPLFL